MGKQFHALRCFWLCWNSTLHLTAHWHRCQGFAQTPHRLRQQPLSALHSLDNILPVKAGRIFNHYVHTVGRLRIPLPNWSIRLTALGITPQSADGTWSCPRQKHPCEDLFCRYIALPSLQISLIIWYFLSIIKLTSSFFALPSAFYPKRITQLSSASVKTVFGNISFRFPFSKRTFPAKNVPFDEQSTT